MRKNNLARKFFVWLALSSDERAVIEAKQNTAFLFSVISAAFIAMAIGGLVVNG